MKLKEEKKSKGIVLGFVGRETSNEKKKRMQQLTNFNETIRLEIWNQFKLQFLKRLKITPTPNNREASSTLEKYPLIKKKLPVAVTSKELTSAANNG